MNYEHDARFDFDVVLVISLMNEEEKDVFVNANKAKLESLEGNANSVEHSAIVERLKTKKVKISCVELPEKNPISLT